jgi:hypothetical protein
VKLNFWRANMLMQLVDENNSLLSNLKYEIPNEYFSFLDDLIIDQPDVAMEVNDYRDFLKSYADFRLKKMNFPYGIVSKNQILEVTETKLAFYTSENCANMLGVLKKNDKIIIKDVLTHGEDKVYRFKAQTTDGRAGWFKMQGVAYLKPAIAEKELELSQYTVDYKRTSIIYVAKIDSLALFADPDDQEKSQIQLLMANQRLIPLDETTLKTYVNRYAGVNYNGTMSKVRTQDGVMGWVNSLLLAEVKTYQSYQDDLTVVNQDPFVVNSLDYFFSDKSLYFVKANILKNDIEFNGKSKLKLALDAYKKSCKSPEYLTAFEAMLKQTKKKYDVDSLSYDAKYSFVKSEKLNLLPNKSFESNFLEHNIPNYEDQLKSEKKIKIFLAYIEMEAEKYVLKQPKDMKSPTRKTDADSRYEKLKIELNTSNSSSLASKPDK